MNDEHAMRALVSSQIVVDDFEHGAFIKSVTMMPGNLLPWEVGPWRAQERDPANHPAWQAAILERDRCLELCGESIVEWLQKWEQAKQRTRAEG